MKGCWVTIGCVGLCMGIAGCGTKAPAAVPPATVDMVRVIEQDWPWTMEYPAQVAGSLEVQVRAQVGGILQERTYQEGAYVTAGTGLFQIDDSAYRVALAKAQGALAQAQASAKNAQRTFERVKRLRADNALSQQDYDNALSSYEAALANVQVAQADVNDAQINLGYTRVTAPISGVTGASVQSVGSLIAPQGDSGLLTTMVQIDPLHINFSMPGSQFNELSSGFSSGKITLGQGDKQHLLVPENYRQTPTPQVPIYVEAVLPDGTVYPQRGKIIFFDQTENAQTSSIAIKAEFANPAGSRSLMPGEFVRVHLVGAVYRQAVLVPSSAVLSTANGLIAYVVKDDHTLELRPIQARLQDGIYIVSQGLKAGEMVVSGGLFKLRAGEKVSPLEQPFTLTPPVLPQAVPAPQGRSEADLEALVEGKGDALVRVPEIKNTPAAGK